MLFFLAFSSICSHFHVLIATFQPLLSFLNEIHYKMKELYLELKYCNTILYAYLLGL